MTTDAGREGSTYAWRPGRGYAGGAVTGVWFAAVLTVLTGVVDVIGSGWRAGLVALVAAQFLGTLLVAVPVFTLVGRVLRDAGRTAAVGGYAAGALVARLLVAPLLGSAAGVEPSSGPQTAGLAALSVLAAVVAALVSTRDRLPRTSGRLRHRAGGQPTGGGVPGPSAAPAPAGRYLSGGP
ncbi:hypothetical protein [Terracoccus sp. 273MFTsu3.1]|uniref:hypothetical protein n=1 Tax=Terracoccus sp. 273MFTsu3.1 TaxID=1172188 RepID=UPI00037A6A67|nr:hypothetical protein [Terracoccus sp. 273MFTsu3.1]